LEPNNHGKRQYWCQIIFFGFGNIGAKHLLEKAILKPNNNWERQYWSQYNYWVWQYWSQTIIGKGYTEAK
jgi:hypothetical protein